MVDRRRGVLIAMLVVFGMVQSAAARTYAINAPGSNSDGWTFLTTNLTTYDDIFKNVELFVGDILSFTFVTNEHDLREVPPAQIGSCNSTSPIQQYTTSVDVTLKTAGQHGFLCSFPLHCENYGMHLLVTVLDVPASGPASGPAPGTPNAVSSLRSGVAMIMGASLAASAVLAL